MSVPRGACPGLETPMPTGDGLLARLRPLDCAIGLDALAAIGRAAGRYGNGLVEITARGSLQIRGVRPDTAAPLAESVRHAVAVETGVPVETPPLAGLDPDELGDPRPFAGVLREAIGEAGLARRIGPKTTVSVEAGGRHGLDGVPADIAVRAEAAGWTVRCGTKERAGLGETETLALVLKHLHGIAASGRPARARPTRHPPALGPVTLRDGTLGLELALGMGGIGAEALEALVGAAREEGGREVRLAPGRALFVVGLEAGGAARLASRAAELGLVTQAGDPRLSLAACAGAGACASGLIASRALAAGAARALPELLDGSFTLHVSGCAKGCAHPGAAGLTLVGVEGGCALVVGGEAASAPVPESAALDGLAHLEGLYRASRHAQESAAQWLARLGPGAVAAGFTQGIR